MEASTTNRASLRGLCQLNEEPGRTSSGVSRRDGLRPNVAERGRRENEDAWPSRASERQEIQWLFEELGQARKAETDVNILGLGQPAGGC